MKTIRPPWSESAPTPGSFRSIAKYGNPRAFKHPSDAWVRMMMQEFGMTEDDFLQRRQEGLESVVVDKPSRLSEAQLNALAAIVGDVNVAVDDYSRVRYASGKTAEEILELRHGVVREIADAVVHPRDKGDVQKLVEFCARERIAITPYGAGSSVNFGCRPYAGGISLALGTHMNAVLEINEVNQTARVQPGILGPAYESALQNAPERFGCQRRYTCGHFPQSFEYSSVGGWIVTLGSGQASTYYGDAYDLVFSQEYVTPAGSFRTIEVPATATGPRINDIMKGSEGAFGVLVEATMKIFRYAPDNRARLGFMYPSWEAAVDASRQIMQGEFGFPAVYRISDPEETDRGLKLYGVPGFADPLLERLGFEPMKRSLCLASVEGDRDYTRLVSRKIKQIAKRHGAISLGSIAMKMWERTRYAEPYMRDDLNDFGILIDTLEAGVTWDNLHRLHQGVRSFVKSRPATMCMTHASHFYPQGTNLYFIFLARMDLEEYVAFQTKIIDKIVENGGTLSHHHGVGRLLAPWMNEHLGVEQMAILRAIKRNFDPDNIMNPGGQLGLDEIPPRR